MSDIDGTLILNNPSATPSPRVINAIKKADEKIFVGVATSRPFNHAEKIINILNLTAPCIVGGGSQIVDPITKKVVWEKRLNNNEVKQIYNIMQKLGMGGKVLDDQDEIIDIYNYSMDPLQIWIQGEVPEVANKIVSELSAIKTIAINKVPGYRKGKIALVITNIHATKQHGILEVAKLLKINTKDIIGIGDGGNDFPLLMACGLKVAMGNAPDDLKAIADYIAPNVEDDGVADVIERFVLNG